MKFRNILNDCVTVYADALVNVIWHCNLLAISHQKIIINYCIKTQKMENKVELKTGS